MGASLSVFGSGHNTAWRVRALAVLASPYGFASRAKSCQPAAVREDCMAVQPSIYDRDLDKNAANYAPLTPLTFIAWAAEVYPERMAVVHGARSFRWREV